MDESQPSSQTGTPAMGWRDKLKSKLVEYGRVLRITKKPSKEEYKTIVKVSGLGILVIGLIGFVMQIIYQVFFHQ